MALLAAPGLAWGHFGMATVGSQHLPPPLFIPNRLGVQPVPPLCHSSFCAVPALEYYFWRFFFPPLTDVKCRDRLKMQARLPESSYTAIKSNQWSGSLCWRWGSWKGFILGKLKCPGSSGPWLGGIVTGWVRHCWKSELGWD